MTVEINNVADLSAYLRAPDTFRGAHTHIRLWFRGQPHAAWKLQPGVYRGEMGQLSDEDRLLTERLMTQDFRVLSAGMRSGGETDSAIYFLQQHYRMPTRLLDWSTSALIALYFAVTNSECEAEDGMLFSMDAHALAGSQTRGDVKFFGIMTSRNPAFESAIDVIADWKTPKQQIDRLIFPIRPDHSDRRIALQRSCFTFHGANAKELTIAENKSLKSAKIPARSKRQIREELSLLGIDDLSVYGDLEHTSSFIKARHDLQIARYLLQS